MLRSQDRKERAQPRLGSEEPAHKRPTRQASSTSCAAASNNPTRDYRSNATLSKTGHADVETTFSVSFLCDERSTHCKLWNGHNFVEI